MNKTNELKERVHILEDNLRDAEKEVDELRQELYFRPKICTWGLQVEGDILVKDKNLFRVVKEGKTWLTGTPYVKVISLNACDYHIGETLTIYGDDIEEYKELLL